MRAKERQKEDFSEFRNHSAPEVEQMEVDNDQQEAALPREEDVERMDEESEEENRLKGEGSLAVSVGDVDILDEDTLHSEIVWIRSLPWRLMLMPRRSHSRTKSLGIFLQCYPTEVEDIVPSTWYCHAVVEFSLERHLENQEPFSRRIEHTFCAK
ncbi:ubiquitin carboxyl-terminal hydrolase 7-like [Oscarella lobularis]|uniref:ubiquitin carboxyl-terminal hydrolase 7-like n=1 Tax=Oscarella lobularis TaxID=121494 RepID=UPI00331407D4